MSRDKGDARRIATRHKTAQSQGEMVVPSEMEANMIPIRKPRRKTDPLDSIRNTLLGLRGKSGLKSAKHDLSSPTEPMHTGPPPRARKSGDRGGRRVKDQDARIEYGISQHELQAEHAIVSDYPPQTSSPSRHSEQYGQHNPSPSPPNAHKTVAETTTERTVTEAGAGIDSAASLPIANTAGRSLRKSSSIEQLPAHLARAAKVVNRVFGNYPRYRKHASPADKPLPDEPGPTDQRSMTPSRSLEASGLESRPDTAKTTATTVLDVVLEEQTETDWVTMSGCEYHGPSDTLLPTLPKIDTTVTNRSSKSSPHSKSSAASSPVQTSSPTSQRTRPRRHAHSPSAPAASIAREMSYVSAGSWEEEVDLMYEQEAESTCDFDWEHVNLSPATSVHPSPDLTFSPQSPTSPGKVRSTPQSPVRRMHQKGGSVGHLGFLAARLNVGDTLYDGEESTGATKSSTLPVMPPSIMESTISEGEVLLANPVSPPRHIHVRNFDSLEVGDLSDPESVRTGGSNHRKSSSCGSHGTMARSLSSGTKKDARWSAASSSSTSTKRAGHSRSATMPSKSESKSDQGRTVSREGTRKDKKPMSEPESLYYRRPQTSGERMALQEAGRAVQRGRNINAGQPQRIVHRPRILTTDTPPQGWI